MKPQMRSAGICAVTFLMVTAASWGAAPPRVAGFNQDQAAPAAGSQPTATAPNRELTLEGRGDVFMARKNYADAADYYYRAIKHSTLKDPLLWNKLGIAFQQQGKYHSAHQAYAGATHVDKNFAEAWNNRGTVYFMEKKFRSSIKYYQRAIELKGDDASFHLNLGTSYYHLKKFELAVEEYRTALGLDPGVVAQESAMGTVVHAGSTDVEYYFFMAKALASVGNAEQAVRYLRRALEDGFKNQKRIDEDPDFKKISNHPAFVELMRNPPVAIKN